MIVCGIDPGLDGAMVFLNKETKKIEAHSMPTYVIKGTKRGLNIPVLLDILTNSKPDIVFIEKVHAMPGQGVTSMFNMGFGLGVLHGLLFAKGIEFIQITPQSWKKKLMDGQPKEKSASVTVASQIWPTQSKLFFTPRGRILDGIADAALIAYYGAFTLLNEEK